MLYQSSTATPARLFNGLKAFFSPRVPPSTKAAWCHHGGRIATVATVGDIHIYFGIHGQHCNLIERLRALEIQAIDTSWILESIKQRKQLDIEHFFFAILDSSQKHDHLPNESLAQGGHRQSAEDQTSQDHEETEGDSDSSAEVVRLLLDFSSSAQAAPISDANETVSDVDESFVLQETFKTDSRTLPLSSQSPSITHQTEVDHQVQLVSTPLTDEYASEAENEAPSNDQHSLPSRKTVCSNFSPSIEAALEFDQLDPSGQEVVECLDEVLNSKDETEVVDAQDPHAAQAITFPSERSTTSTSEGGADTDSKVKEMTTPKVLISSIESPDRALASPGLEFPTPNESSPTQLRNASTPSSSNSPASHFSPFFASLFNAQVQSHTAFSAFPTISAETLLSSLPSTLPSNLNGPPNSSIRDGLCLMDHGENGFYARRRAGVTGSRSKRKKSEGESPEKGEGKKKRLR